MVDSSRGVGSSGLGGVVSNVRDTVVRDSRASRDIAGGGGASRGATPNGPRGRRMLAADTPVDSLDRSAPRGTYLDILA